MYQEKLRLRLESGEPKCANCIKWAQIWPVNTETGKPVGDCLMLELKTTDLTVCSKWEQKD